MSGFSLTINPDGAGFQAQAVLAYLRYHVDAGLEASYDSVRNHYRAQINVCRYDNAREQGYVVYMRDATQCKQINIAFYEHRNSDTVCAVVNNKLTFNAPLLTDITSGMTDSADYDHEVRPGRAYEMAEWIVEQLRDYWIANHPDE